LLLSAGNLRDSSFLNVKLPGGNVFDRSGDDRLGVLTTIRQESLFEKFQQIEVLVFSYVAAAVTGLGATLRCRSHPVDGLPVVHLAGVGCFCLSDTHRIQRGHAPVFAAAQAFGRRYGGRFRHICCPCSAWSLRRYYLDERLSAVALAGAGSCFLPRSLVVRYDTKST
jgi:hypothetical protein